MQGRDTAAGCKATLHRARGAAGRVFNWRPRNPALHTRMRTRHLNAQERMDTHNCGGSGASGGMRGGGGSATAGGPPWKRHSRARYNPPHTLPCRHMSGAGGVQPGGNLPALHGHTEGRGRGVPPARAASAHAAEYWARNGPRRRWGGVVHRACSPPPHHPLQRYAARPKTVPRNRVCVCVRRPR